MWSGLGLVGLFVFALFWFNREDWRPQSAVWPETILWVLLGLSLLLISKCVLRWQVQEILGEGSRRRMLIGSGALILWAVGMQTAGFIVTSVVVFPLLSAWLVSEERALSNRSLRSVTLRQWVGWLSIILIEISVLYFVFSEILLVPLPNGF